MKVVHVTSFREFAEAGVRPYRSAEHPWNYLLQSDEGTYAFSLNKDTPTTWTEPCEAGCKEGWHKGECIRAFRAKIDKN